MLSNRLLKKAKQRSDWRDSSSFQRPEFCAQIEGRLDQALPSDDTPALAAPGLKPPETAVRALGPPWP